MFGKAHLMDDAATEAAFDEFVDNFVPGHMQTRFTKTFGVPKATFGNRFFYDDAVYHRMNIRIESIIALEPPIEFIVLYGSSEHIEGHWMKGEARRRFEDIFGDDWHAACGIAKSPGKTLYLFVEPKGRGCIVKIHRESEDEAPLVLIEHDEEP